MLFMNWNEIFDADQIPCDGDIKDYLGEAKSNWDELTTCIEKTYQVKPQITYSKLNFSGINLKRNIANRV